MNEQQARETVVKAGIELVESGLIVRTWGNVSCRIDDTRFAVTPSGRAYETLRTKDIVICNIEDASWSGDITPSKEKGIHALIYRSNKDAGFVIHTHQKFASAVASSSVTVMLDEKMGGVPVAAYGLPGMKKLMRGVEAALSQAGGAVLMSYHGALCYGKDYEQTFATAHALEEACERFMHTSYLKDSGAKDFDKQRMLDYYVNKVSGSVPSVQDTSVFSIKSSRRDGTGFVAITADGEFSYPDYTSSMPDEARIHAAIYTARADINNIELAADENVIAVSLAKKPLPQLLDDFAQMMGKPMRIAQGAEPNAIVKALKKTGGVLIPGVGALCCAATRTDAHAVKLVTEKDALAEICATMLGTPKPISAIECFLMHLVYSKSYAKQAARHS